MNEIITYGRPGTPMPAWGIEGGGPKNDQAISDLTAYLQSIQLSPAKAKAQVTKNVVALKAQAKAAVKTAQDNLATARENLAGRRRRRRPASPTRSRSPARPRRSSGPSRSSARSRTPSQGELLFDVNCARCHTKGWSYNDPAKPNVPEPGPAGGGAFGPSLRGGAVLEQFPGLPADDVSTPGFQSQYDWVSDGVEARKGYGVRGHLERRHGALRPDPDQAADQRHHQVRAEPLVGANA